MEKGPANSTDPVLEDGDAIRLENTVFAYCFKEASSSTTIGSDIEHNRYVGPVSSIMRTLTSKYGEFLSQFDTINDSEDQISITSLRRLLVNNHDVAANIRKLRVQLPLENIFGFCRIFKKVTEQIGFHLT